MNAGEVLAFDYRVLHRALDHYGKEIRPVLYCTVLCTVLDSTVSGAVLHLHQAMVLRRHELRGAAEPRPGRRQDAGGQGAVHNDVSTSSRLADCLS